MPTTIYAQLTGTGTAAAETAVCADHLHTIGPADPAAVLAGAVTRPVDCSANEALSCQVCGALSHWRYVAVLGAQTAQGERESAIELPAGSATEALTLAASTLGKTVWEVFDAHPDAEPLNNTPDDARIVGYTIERYDGETDGEWSINGGIRADVLNQYAGKVA